MSSVTRDELKLLVFEVREGLPVDVVKAEAARLLGDVDLAAAVAEDAGLGRRTGLEREAVRLSYPSWMFESFTNDFGPRPARRSRGDELAGAHGLRVNTARVSREALTARLAEEHVVAKATPLAPAGLVLETRVNAFGLSAFQEASSRSWRGQPARRGARRAAARRPRRRRLRRRGRQDARDRRVDGEQGGCSRSTPTARSSRSLRRRARRAGLTNVAARPVTDEGTRCPPTPSLGVGSRARRRALLGAGHAAPEPEARWRSRRRP